MEKEIKTVNWDTARDSDKKIRPIENFTKIKSFNDFQDLNDVIECLALVSMDEIIKLIDRPWIIQENDIA